MELQVLVFFPPLTFILYYCLQNIVRVFLLQKSTVIIPRLLSRELNNLVDALKAIRTPCRAGTPREVVHGKTYKIGVHRSSPSRDRVITMLIPLLNTEAYHAHTNVSPVEAFIYILSS